MGVCVSRWDLSLVADVGRLAERWRYAQEDFIGARASALGTMLTPESEAPIPDAPIVHGRHDMRVHDPLLIDTRFCEVPKHLLHPKRWKIIQSRKWAFKENILRTEGRAYIWCLRRAVRSVKTHNKHILLAHPTAQPLQKK